jgi:hypothetical protein
VGEALDENCQTDPSGDCSRRLREYSYRGKDGTNHLPANDRSREHGSTPPADPLYFLVSTSQKPLSGHHKLRQFANHKGVSQAEHFSNRPCA